MSDEQQINQGRRKFLVLATSAAAGVAGVAVAATFVSSWLPSERAKALGAPVEVDISKLEPGQQITVEWQGKPVWVVNRTAQQIKELPSLDGELADPGSATASQQPAYCQNALRSIKPEYIVLVGICTHLGCSPAYRPDVAPADLGADWKGGFYCPCHGSKFDLAGRVYKGVPAPTNLPVPEYVYLDDKTIRIGEGKA